MKRFDLGLLLITPAAQEVLITHHITPIPLFKRHQCGDWGEVCDEDAQANQEALRTGSRLMSVYRVHDTQNVWVITEADRSSTTLLLPSEY